MKDSISIAFAILVSLVSLESRSLTLTSCAAGAEPAQASERTPLDMFLVLTGDDNAQKSEAIAAIVNRWNDDDAAMLVEVARFAKDRATRESMFALLATSTGQSIGPDLHAWYEWIWNRKDTPHPDYATFKKRLYSRIDPRFAEYFDNSRPATIRLDEICWGGVLRDGIPPLKNPETIAAVEADYLADSDIVFGVEFGGKARAYPKRILAWHEMVKDVVGGHSINGVYCTLCGSMIVYDTELNGKHYELGTSGFLYRSNKLMYDHETKSMWSTLGGTPVVGPLVGKGIMLKPRHVVTTTWGEWKTRHPDTDVLSLSTGHRRNYGEGVAYAAYFATDELMFTVPKLDRRLKNKDEVLIVRISDESPIAISTEFLNRNRIYHVSISDRNFVVLTHESGANRVYESGSVRFDGWEKDVLSSDHSSVSKEETLTKWRLTEDALVSIADEAKDRKTLPRVSAHRAFWFGWYSAYPETTLIK